MRSRSRMQIGVCLFLIFLTTVPVISMACDSNLDCETGYYCYQSKYECWPCSQCLESSPNILSKCLDDGIPFFHSCTCSNIYCDPYSFNKEPTTIQSPYLDTTTNLPTSFPTTTTASTRSTVNSTILSIPLTQSVGLSSPVINDTATFNHSPPFSHSPALPSGGTNQDNTAWITVVSVFGAAALLLGLFFGLRYFLKNRRSQHRNDHIDSNTLDPMDVKTACRHDIGHPATQQSQSYEILPLLVTSTVNENPRQPGEPSMGEVSEKRDSSDSGVGPTEASSAQPSPSGSSQHSSTDLTQSPTPAPHEDMTGNPTADHHSLEEEEEDSKADYMKLATPNKGPDSKGAIQATTQTSSFPGASASTHYAPNLTCLKLKNIMTPEILRVLSEYLDPKDKWKEVGKKLANIDDQRLAYLKYHLRGNIDGDTPTTIVLRDILDFRPNMEIEVFIRCLHEMKEEHLIAQFAKWHSDCPRCTQLSKIRVLGQETHF